jgi:hypothetical protein
MAWITTLDAVNGSTTLVYDSHVLHASRYSILSVNYELVVFENFFYLYQGSIIAENYL